MGKIKYMQMCGINVETEYLRELTKLNTKTDPTHADSYFKFKKFIVVYFMN